MDEAIELIDAAHFPFFDKLRQEGKHLRTPNAEEVVYFTAQDGHEHYIRGTRQEDGKWIYEYVPGVGY